MSKNDELIPPIELVKSTLWWIILVVVVAKVPAKASDHPRVILQVPEEIEDA